MLLYNVPSLILEPVYQLLPAKMRSSEATALLLTIGLQESRFEHRIQLIGNHRRWWESVKGPARSFVQFERAGIRGVLRHRASRQAARDVLKELNYPESVRHVHAAVAHNDLLAFCLARLLLWTHPGPLPALTDNPEVSWQYYLALWRPGKPHRETWNRFWHTAVELVRGTSP